MARIEAQREGSGDGGTVYLKLSFYTALAIKRAIVGLVSHPESPLVPPEDERPLLALYDALDQVTSWPAPRKPQDRGLDPH